MQIRLSDPSQYQSIVDAEWNIIYSKLEKIVQSGAKVVLSRLAIGDLATQYFADRDIFCAGRVSPCSRLRHEPLPNSGLKSADHIHAAAPPLALPTWHAVLPIRTRLSLCLAG